MNKVTIADVIAHSYVEMEAPLTPTLRENLQSYIDDQFIIIGDPERSMNDEVVIHAVQNLNTCVNLMRRIGDMEKLYAAYMQHLREEALDIAGEIDSL